MDSPNRDPTPRFGESHQKSGTSGPDTRLAKATQGRPNSTQPARSGESLRPDKRTSRHTYFFATPPHTTNFITPQHTYLRQAIPGRKPESHCFRDRWRCSKPTNQESGTASGTALPLPSKTRRSRHKYSSRSQPSIDRPLPVPLYSPLSAILRLAALGLNPIPSQPLVY
ncbi:hypothetical protein PCANC_05954 [Puccinia coronata f. sp. avenae]|uniref:Uncharacterized protein n=1 Tax=Puccinia coronata f. sp. avenae TaxID=200324 RepID=A0A2N5VU37_9BASI|nr:hypothetical protein PCANC_05954 [Puccinia coronata f. sp. avenae]